MTAGSADRLLVADIGGTWARFALVVDGRIGRILAHPVADYDSPLAAMRHFISEGEAPPRRAALAVAGPVVEGCAELTNANWRFEAEALSRALDLEVVLLLNDFEAIAHALPVLPPEALVQIGGGRAEPGAPRAVIGPGTGLGVAGLLSVGGRSLVVRSEGGHATVATGTPREEALVHWLQDRFDHVSAERVISGEGLVNLYQAVAGLAGETAEPLEPAAVTERALSGRDPQCAEALTHFCALLGCAAGNLALTFWSRGGLYLAGGIAPRILPFLEASDFRARFEAKGRLGDFLAEIPTWAIVEDHPAFYGLIAADRQALGTPALAV